MTQLRLCILLSLLIFAAGPVVAQTSPTLVEDLATEPYHRTIFRGFGLAAHGDGALFLGDDGSRGIEIWTTDGTADGTKLWAEVCPGICDLDPEMYPAYGTIVSDGTRAFFIADDSVHGVELWTSDGTQNGTRLVADICPGPCGSQIRYLSRAASKIWFSVDTLTTGIEPWVSDGTPQGTFPLGDLLPGDLSSNPQHFLPFGQGVAFQAYTQELGTEWWQSDGTVEGTRPLTDLCPGPCSAISNNPVSTNGSILFSAHLPPEEPLYLLSPGSEAQKLGDLCTPECDNLISFLYPVGNRFYFRAGQDLWSTDLTAQGTGPVATLPPDSRLVQQVLGLDDGTILVNIESKPYNSGIYRLDAGGLSSPLIYVDGLLTSESLGAYAVAVDTYSSSNLSVYRTDGTPAGTAFLGNLSGRDSAIYAGRPIRMGERAVLNASTNQDFSGQDLWALDFEGPELLLGSTERPGTSRPAELSTLGSSTLLYTSQNSDAEGLDYELRQISPTSDGTGSSKRLASNIEPNSLVTLELETGPRAFFRGFGEFYAARESWISDGSETGTKQLLFAGSPISWPRDPRAFQGRLVFFGDQSAGQKIWLTDGNGDDPKLVIDLEPEWQNVHVGCGVCSPPVYPGPIFPRDLTLMGPQGIAFVARQEESGSEVWFSDGTSQGTHLIADLHPGPTGSEPEFLIAVGDHLLFAADSGDGRGWWSWSQGQAPIRLAEVIEVVTTVSMEGRAFWLERSATGFVLGSSDGTDLQRTELPADLVPDDLLVNIGDRLFFVAADPQAGAELWTAIPQAGGTATIRRVADLWPGSHGSFPKSLNAVSDELIFSADDGVHGREAWRFHPLTDLVPSLVADLAPGTASSSARDFTTVSATDGKEFLLFSADDGTHGRELWSMPTTTDTELCESDNESLCLQGGRFRVSARWKVPSSGATGAAQAVPQSPESGHFWFFNPNNLELVVKVLDGTAINGAYWFFYGALSDVEYWIDVEDLVTGTSRSWHNPPGRLCGDADVNAFPVGSLHAATSGLALPDPGLEASLRTVEEPTHTAEDPFTKTEFKIECVSDQHSLCLLNRFRVSVDWITDDGSGRGHGLPATSETGFFWFFGGDNTELVVKMLDGGPINGRFWFFYGALTDVEYTIRVLDTVTEQEVIYHNPQGNLCGGSDTDVFPSL